MRWLLQRSILELGLVVNAIPAPLLTHGAHRYSRPCQRHSGHQRWPAQRSQDQYSHFPRGSWHQWHQYLALSPVPKGQKSFFFFFERGTKFNTEATDCFGIISGNPQNQLGLWMCPGNFHQLNFTIKSHHLDSVIGSILNLRHLFTWICIDNPLWGHPETLYQLYFSLAGTVKSCPNGSKCLHYGSAIIAFDCIKGGDPRKSFQPSQMFLQNVSQVRNIEGILIILQ